MDAILAGDQTNLNELSEYLTPAAIQELGIGCDEEEKLRQRFRQEFLAWRDRSRIEDFLYKSPSTGQTVLVSAGDVQLAESLIERGRELISCCPEHTHRCKCWLPIRQKIWHLQNLDPSAPLAVYLAKVWDELETLSPPGTASLPGRAIIDGETYASR